MRLKKQSVAIRMDMHIKTVMAMEIVMMTRARRKKNLFYKE